MKTDWDRVVVPVSGGKDSQVVLSIAVKTFPLGIIEAVHQDTSYDHPLTYEHLKWMQDFYKVPITTTRSSKYSSVFDLIRKIKYFPTRQGRACTGRLKVTPFSKWLVDTKAYEHKTLIMLGMRQQESRDRAERYKEVLDNELYSICDISTLYSKKLESVQANLPIVDKSTPWVFEYLRKEGAKINSLYAKGHRRVGCYPCLLAGDREWILASRDPVGRKHMQTLLDIEKEINTPDNHRKMIKLSVERNVEKMLKDAACKKNDPFGFQKLEEDDGSTGCAQCNF